MLRGAGENEFNITPYTAQQVLSICQMSGVGAGGNAGFNRFVRVAFYVVMMEGGCVALHSLLLPRNLNINTLTHKTDTTETATERPVNCVNTHSPTTNQLI